MPDKQKNRGFSRPRSRRRKRTEAEDVVQGRGLALRLLIGALGLAAFALLYTFGGGPPAHRGASLLEAIEQNRLPEVERLLAAGVDPNTADDEDVTVLMHAAYYGRAAVADALLRRGARPNVRDRDGQTALAWAGAHHPEIARDLLEHGADPNARDRSGKPLLLIACAAGGDTGDLIRALLAHGANPNVSAAGGTPLLGVIRAGKHGDAGLARLLLMHGADPNADAGDGIAPLILAVEKRNPDIVQALLSRGAILTATDHLDRTALEIARDEGDPTLIALLHGGDR